VAAVVDDAPVAPASDVATSGNTAASTSGNRLNFDSNLPQLSAPALVAAGPAPPPARPAPMAPTPASVLDTSLSKVRWTVREEEVMVATKRIAPSSIAVAGSSRTSNAHFGSFRFIACAHPAR